MFLNKHGQKLYKF